MLIKKIADFFGGAASAKHAARAQRYATEAQIKYLGEAQEKQEDLGREGARGIGRAVTSGRRDLERRSGVASRLYDSRADVGEQALSRLQSAILGGEGLRELAESDPTIAFAREEGRRALANRSRAEGSYGGAMSRSLMQLNQNLANQGIDRALGRLGSLEAIGRQATQSQAQLQERLGANQSLLGMQGAMGQANALSLTGQRLVPFQQAMAGSQAALAAGPSQATANLIGHYASSGPAIFSPDMSFIQGALPAAGAVVGGMYGGPAGAQAGYGVGSAVANRLPMQQQQGFAPGGGNMFNLTPPQVPGLGG